MSLALSITHSGVWAFEWANKTNKAAVKSKNFDFIIMH
jgi:hypothetical protein